MRSPCFAVHRSLGLPSSNSRFTVSLVGPREGTGPPHVVSSGSLRSPGTEPTDVSDRDRDRPASSAGVNRGPVARRPRLWLGTVHSPFPSVPSRSLAGRCAGRKERVTGLRREGTAGTGPAACRPRSSLTSVVLSLRSLPPTARASRCLRRLYDRELISYSLRLSITSSGHRLSPPSCDHC